MSILYLVQALEVGRLLDVGGVDVPRVQLTLRRLKLRPIVTPFLDFPVNLLEHGRYDVFLFDGLDFGPSGPNVVQENRLAIDSTTLNKSHSLN